MICRKGNHVLQNGLYQFISFPIIMGTVHTMETGFLISCFVSFMTLISLYTEYIIEKPSIYLLAMLYGASVRIRDGKLGYINIRAATALGGIACVICTTLIQYIFEKIKFVLYPKP